MVALQCCVGFCYTTTWITHNFIYIYIERGHICICIYTHKISPLSSPLPSPITTLGHHRPSCWAPCFMQQLPTSYQFYTIVQMCQCYFPKSLQSLLPQLCPQVGSLCLCFHSFPANGFISTIFPGLHIYIHIYVCVCVLVNNICFVFLIYFTLNNKLYLFIYLTTTDSNSFFFMSAPILTCSLTPHTMKRTLVKSNTR